MKHNITLITTIVLLALSFIFLAETPYFISSLIIISIIFIGLIILGSSFIQLNYFVKSVNKGNNNGIALTFDDGPNPITTPKILDILAKENIKATFFVIGNNIASNKELLIRIKNEGHTIGNHTFSHAKSLTYISTSKLKIDIDKCSQSIKKLTQQSPVLFRPPFGITTPRYNRALQQLNLTSVGWSIRSLDTKAKNAKSLYNKIIQKISNGSIILFHDTQLITLEILPDIVHFCKKNGIKIVPLPELINTKAYE